MKRTALTAHKHVLQRGILFLFLVCCASANFADNVDFATALRIARQYVKVSQKAAKGLKTRSAAAPQPYYVFNDTSGKGFVVVAGDDKMGEVLAYSHEASIDMANLNPEARYLFDAYREVYEALGKDKTLSTRAAVASAGVDHVDPLLKTNWGQFYPYSKKTHYVTGCVATAVAQVMRFHEWPAQGTGKASYTVGYDKTVRSADFSQSHYDWDNMLPSYNRVKATAQQEDAVALLMNDVGIASEMQYSKRESGTESVMAERALRKHFDYDAAMVTRSEEGVYEFINILKKELRNGFPLYMSGFTAGGGSGHAWVCDGFDNEDRFHMNLGWDGQANGYYSVAAMSLTSTGQEFNGRPMSFNRRIQVIAIHPNKPGTPKIDADIAYQSPNIRFDYGSDMAFVGDAPAKLSDNAKVMYSRFINQSNSKFEGDVGVAVYSEDGTLVSVVPYAQDGKKIFTRERFPSDEGKMASGGVIDEQLNFTLDLTALTGGTYTIRPVAARMLDDGKLGAWARMKKSPRIVMKVEDGKVSYLELPSKKPAYQLAEEPRFEQKLVAGEANTLHLLLRKLDANFFDGTVKVEFLDGEGKVAYSAQTAKAVDFDIYATTKVSLPIELPYDFAAGEYRLRTTVAKAADEVCQVLEKDLKEPYKVSIEERKKAGAFASMVFFVQDRNQNSIPGEEIDVRREPTFRVNCIARLGKGNRYKGELMLYMIDTQTEVSIPLMKTPAKVDLAGEGSTTVIASDWIDPRVEQLVNTRLYRLAVIGEVDGRNVDLRPASSKPTFISVINNDGTNGIDAARFEGKLLFQDGCLTVQRQGLKRVEVYGLNGVRVASGDADAADNVVLPLPEGTYVVRMTTQEGIYSAVIR